MYAKGNSRVLVHVCPNGDLEKPEEELKMTSILRAMQTELPVTNLVKLIRSLVLMMHSGVPPDHSGFWERLGVAGVQKLYYSLSVTRSKVLSLLNGQCYSAAEERIYGYLTTMIGNIAIAADGLQQNSNLATFAISSIRFPGFGISLQPRWEKIDTISALTSSEN